MAPRGRKKRSGSSAASSALKRHRTSMRIRNRGGSSGGSSGSESESRSSSRRGRKRTASGRSTRGRTPTAKRRRSSTTRNKGPSSGFRSKVKRSQLIAEFLKAGLCRGNKNLSSEIDRLLVNLHVAQYTRYDIFSVVRSALLKMGQRGRVEGAPDYQRKGKKASLGDGTLTASAFDAKIKGLKGLSPDAKFNRAVWEIVASNCSGLKSLNDAIEFVLNEKIDIKVHKRAIDEIYRRQRKKARVADYIDNTVIKFIAENPSITRSKSRRSEIKKELGRLIALINQYQINKTSQEALVHTLELAGVIRKANNKGNTQNLRRSHRHTVYTILWDIVNNYWNNLPKINAFIYEVMSKKHSHGKNGRRGSSKSGSGRRRSGSKRRRGSSRRRSSSPTESRSSGTGSGSESEGSAVASSGGGGGGRRRRRGGRRGGRRGSSGRGRSSGGRRGGRRGSSKRKRSSSSKKKSSSTGRKRSSTRGGKRRSSTRGGRRGGRRRRSTSTSTTATGATTTAATTGTALTAAAAALGQPVPGRTRT